MTERLNRTCCVIVNYQTPDLLEVAVRSFKSFYPDVPLFIVDNGSSDNSGDVISSLALECTLTFPIFLATNLGHGPGMDRVISEGEYDYYFFLDSDTVTRKGGFLEEMLLLFGDPDVYGVGEMLYLNRRGFNVEGGTPMLEAAYMLIRQKYYSDFPPFAHHGAPVVANFGAAADAGKTFQSFPVSAYIDHLHRGTVARYGYGLGLRGKLNYLLHKLGL